MKQIDEKVSILLHNIINNWFDLQDAFESVFGELSILTLINLKCDFDELHEKESDENER